MNRKKIILKIISVFSATTLFATTITPIPVSANTTNASYSFKGYDIEYWVKNEWNNGQSIEIKITNTSDEPILNWAFKYDAKGLINGLWNASVYDTKETNYIIKNVGWNYEIAPNSSVSFGYTLSDYNGTNPDNFELCAKRVDKTDGYDVQYIVTNEWDTGLQGEIIITNTSEEPLEAWELSFDSTFEINKLWNGKIISSENNHYVIASEMWSNPVTAGESKTLGFTGLKAETVTPITENFSISSIVIGDVNNDNGSGNYNSEEDDGDYTFTKIDIDTDTDGDGLVDALETVLRTDIENIDTDEDGLTDYEEVYITNSDPTVYNSINEILSDSEADSDEDGLSTRDELNLGTTPSQADTDNDRIIDGDEVNIWHTDSLVADTDGDGIIDGDEIAIGLDPTNPETFGYSDIEYKSIQHIGNDSEAFSSINNEENDVFTYSIDVTGSGYIEPYIFAKESGYSYVMKNDYMIGIAPELVYNGNYDIDNIKVSFTIKEDYISKNISNEEEKEAFLSKFNIFRYYESANALLPVATYRDIEHDVLYTITDDTTTFCLMDMESWLDMLELYLKNHNTTNSTGSSSTSPSGSINLPQNTKTDYMIDIIFVLQSAGDNEEYFYPEKETIRNLSAILFENCSDVRIAIVEYKKYSYSDSVDYNYSIDELEEALNAISYDVLSNTKCERGRVFKAIKTNANYRETPNRFIMHFPNGSSYNMYMNGNHISDCGAEVNVSEFVPDNMYYDHTFQIKNSIESHNGLYLTYDDITPNQLYEHIINHLKEPEREFKALLPTGWKEITLSSPLVYEGTSDSDNDGLTDWEEIDNTKIKWDSTGKIQQITMEEFYREVNEYGFEELRWAYPYIDTIFKRATCLPLKSDPTNSDSDNDGLLDGKEIRDTNDNNNIIAPKDDEVMIDNWPTGLWKHHINTYNNKSIPHKTEKWYGQTEYDCENIGVEGFVAFDKEIEWYKNTIKNQGIQFVIDLYANIAKALIFAQRWREASMVLNEIVKTIYEQKRDSDDENSPFNPKVILASLGSRLLNFKMDEQGQSLHSQSRSWQAIGGYNNFYDKIFSIFTLDNMDSEKFKFSENMSMSQALSRSKINIDGLVNNEIETLAKMLPFNPDILKIFNIDVNAAINEIRTSYYDIQTMDFILWIWRGDYLNLGPGAEMGLYFRPYSLPENDPLDHYYVLPGFTAHMQLFLYEYDNFENIRNLITWVPNDEQWWITGFNPDLNEIGTVDYKKQIMIGMIDFSDFDDGVFSKIYDNLKNRMKERDDLNKYCIFQNNKLWIIWGIEDLWVKK